MDLKEKIKSLIQQGALYRTQGLLTEAISKYNEAIALLEKQQKLKNKENLIEGVQKKIKAVEAELTAFEEAEMTPEIPSQVQDLIKQQFAFSEDKDMAALEGAIALAKFGQLNRAMQEFNELLELESIRVDAAKNIIRCHMTLSSLEESVEEYKSWLANDIFKPDQLNKIRVFLEATLEKSGIDVELPTAESQTPPQPTAEAEPQPGEAVIEMPEIEMVDTEATADEAPAMEIELPEMDEDEILDINSIGITPETGPKAGKQMELNVNFQSGDVISILLPGRDKDTIDFLTPDLELNDVQFYSPIAIFSGTAKVISNTRIESGPRRGDFSIDMKVISS